MAPLPPFAPFPPSTALHAVAASPAWKPCVDAWLVLLRARLGQTDAMLATAVHDDESISVFVAAVVKCLATVEEENTIPENLRKGCFLLLRRLLRLSTPPGTLLQWDLLTDACRVYGRRRMGRILAGLSSAATTTAETSLQGIKRQLLRRLESSTDHNIEELQKINLVVCAWPETTAPLFLAGSDYVDALVSCYGTPSTPSTLRRSILTHLYVCLVGMTEGAKPKLAQLTDILYGLRGTAQEQQQSSPSLVVELVTTTPLLQQIRQRAEENTGGSISSRLENALKQMEQFRRAGRGPTVPARRRKVKETKETKETKEAKGKDKDITTTPHAHPWSQISQIQDLFPDLGSAFIAKLLDVYDDDAEQVVAHLLEDDLPAPLREADRSENLPPPTHHMAPHATPPTLPERHNVYDDDALDRLELPAPKDQSNNDRKQSSNLHFGKQASRRTADDVLRDRGSIPEKEQSKAAILAALAAFDADDDERDDTYDADDVGGVVEDGEEESSSAGNTDATLFQVYQTTPEVVTGRDAATRRSKARMALRVETRLTDEAIEGWAVMLARNPQRRRRLEVQAAASTSFTGQQETIARTAWREGDGEEEFSRGRGRGRGGRGGRGGGRGRGGGGRGGNVAGPTGDKDTEAARRRKEAHKGSRANHNRRDQRARKMARGG